MNTYKEHKKQHVKVRTKRSLAQTVTAKTSVNVELFALHSAVVCMCVPKFVQLNYYSKDIHYNTYMFVPKFVQLFYNTVVKIYTKMPTCT